jgi:hypothetical protein
VADNRWVSANAGQVAKVGNWQTYDDDPSAESASALSGWEAVSETSPVGGSVTAIPSTSSVSTNSYIRKALGALNGDEYITYPVESPTNVSSSLVLYGAVPAMEIKRNDATAENVKGKVAVQYILSGNTWTDSQPLLGPPSAPYTTPTWYNGTVVRKVHPWIGTEVDIYGNTANEIIPQSTSLRMKIYDVCTIDTNITEFWEVGMLLKYTTKPTTSISSITGLSGSTAPTINYTYADGDSFAHTWTHVVIHTVTGLTNPAAEGGGSVHNAVYQDPELALKIGTGSITIEDAGSINTLEPGTTYYAYVRVGKTTSNGTIVMSNWTAASSFTITAPKPVAPTLTVTNDTTYEKVLVTCTDQNNQLTLDNSSFEGGVGDWTPLANVSKIETVNATPSADHGDWSAKITPTGTSTAEIICIQSIDVKPSTSYSVSAKGRKQTGVNAMGVAIRWFDVNGATISTTSYSSTVPTTTTWTTTTVTGTSPATAVRAQALFRFTTPASAADYGYLDTVSFAATTTFGPGLESKRYEIERSLDQVAWTPVANTPVYEPLWGTARLSDYGAPRNTTAYYRARTAGTVNGVTTYSDYTTANTGAIPNNTYWRLSQVPQFIIPKIVVSQVATTNVATLTTAEPHGFKIGDNIVITSAGSPYNGTYAVRSVVSATQFTVTVVSGTVAAARQAAYAEKIITSASVPVSELSNQIEEALGVYKPLGSPGTLYVSSGVYNADGSFDITATTSTQWNEIELILNHDGELVLRTPYGEDIWMKLTGRQWSTSGTTAKLVRRVSCEYVGVEVH